MDKFKQFISSLQGAKDLNKLRSINIASLRDAYEHRRQTILIAIIVASCIFFVFYWTNSFINSRVSSYTSDAQSTFDTIGKVVDLSAKIEQGKRTTSSISTGLLSFLQTTSTNVGLGGRMVNLRSIPSASNIEHASLRFENVYYDELIKFISNIEKFDNLYVKSLTFNRRFDNDKKIDVSLEIVKS